MSDAWDVQIGGDHYKKLEIQPMEYSMANGLDPLQHTIVKYATRTENLLSAITQVQVYVEGKENVEGK